MSNIETMTLDEALRSIKAKLSAEQQETLAKLLSEYAVKLPELKAAIDKGTEQIRRGEVREITDTAAFLDEIAARRGRH
jgi:hypothetical protein